MRACHVAAVFEEIAPVSSAIASDLEAGLIGFRFGDPDVEVTGVGMCWWMSEEVIDACVDRGINMLICHEGELWRGYESPFHTNLPPQTLEFNLRKIRNLMDHGMCVYTAHSNWDLQATVGMGPTLAKALGFTDLIGRDVAVGVYGVETTTFAELVEHVKSAMNLDHVRVQGDPDRRVETVVLGWGSMGSEVEAILANHADAGIFGELREWPFLFAREAGVGIIETGHCVSESVGAQGMVDEMKRRLPNVSVEWLDVPDPWRLE
jgi:putative NIF3 family GTP cyclohydrolase 1 type 2